MEERGKYAVGTLFRKERKKPWSDETWNKIAWVTSIIALISAYREEITLIINWICGQL